MAPTPDGGEEAAASRVAEARRRAALAGGGDGIARHLLVLARVLDSLQRQTRRALGLEDRGRRAEPPGPPPVPPRAETRPKLDLSRLSDATMETLMEIAATLEDTRG